jgi:hypothetical protein
MPADKPTHRAFLVEDKGQDVKANWKEVAPVWSHRDNKGFDVVIPPGMSLSGRVVIREASERPEQSNGGAKATGRPTNG